VFHHFLEQTYQHSLDLYSPTVITHRWLKLFLSLARLWWKWRCQQCTHVHTSSSFSAPILTCSVPKSNSQWYNIPLHSLETTSLTSDESRHSYAWRITTQEQSCRRLKAPMLSKLGWGGLWSWGEWRWNGGITHNKHPEDSKPTRQPETSILHQIWAEEQESAHDSGAMAEEP